MCAVSVKGARARRRWEVCAPSDAALAPRGCLFAARLALGLRLLATLPLACSETAPHLDPRASHGDAGSDATTPTSTTLPDAPPAPELDPGFKAIHRLNSAEYNATVADVLGTALQPASANWRGGELAGFNNIASVLGIDDAQYDRYFGAAQTLAKEVFASDTLRARFVSCDITQTDCPRQSIQAMGLRVFRRPLTETEILTYERVHREAIALGDSESQALELVLRALLSSAEFLFRIEFDPDPSSTVPHLLDAFELASRLSYFLWSSAPDEELLSEAANGSLLQPPVLSATVDRMLDDPRSERLLQSFAGQWLGARQVVAHPVALEFYQWSPEVARAAGDEMLSYFEEFFRTERSWFEFPTADINFVDGWLSRLYGMPTPLGSHERVEFTDDERAGFFGLAGFLALTSFDRRTSPSLRGRWIASNLLCTKLSAPPAAVPELAEGPEPSELNVRAALEQHRQNPECAACHVLFDAYGLALEEYDPVGQHRTHYAEGVPIDATGIVPAANGTSSEQTIVGLDGLAHSVASNPQFGRCLMEKLFTYGLGRVVSGTDLPYLDQVQASWTAADSVPTIRRLIHGLILSEPFRLRRGEGVAMVEESL